MSQRPIIFSGPMVRAILNGRKTQTRRVLKPKRDTTIADTVSAGRKHGLGEWREVPLDKLVMPYAVGDRLWVRETVACGACAPSPPRRWSPGFWRREQGTSSNPNGLWYAADGLAPENPITRRGKWVPSIHMPRWASRITLEVAAIKVERLQNISDEDAIAEGVCTFAESLDTIGWGNISHDDRIAMVRATYGSAVNAYRHLWESLHGADSWEANPWVAVITFSEKARCG